MNLIRGLAHGRRGTKDALTRSPPPPQMLLWVMGWYTATSVPTTFSSTGKEKRSWSTGPGQPEALPGSMPCRCSSMHGLATHHAIPRRRSMNMESSPGPNRNRSTPCLRAWRDTSSTVHGGLLLQGCPLCVLSNRPKGMPASPGSGSGWSQHRTVDSACIRVLRPSPPLAPLSPVRFPSHRCWCDS